ncbi:MAG: hypothetical protein JNM97_06465 [Rhodoferax sp.]|nr:hypothetical protein [Rhodoferax sp.]
MGISCSAVGGSGNTAGVQAMIGTRCIAVHINFKTIAFLKFACFNALITLE